MELLRSAREFLFRDGAPLSAVDLKIDEVAKMLMTEKMRRASCGSNSKVDQRPRERRALSWMFLNHGPCNVGACSDKENCLCGSHAPKVGEGTMRDMVELSSNITAVFQTMDGRMITLQDILIENVTSDEDLMHKPWVAEVVQACRDGTIDTKLPREVWHIPEMVATESCSDTVACINAALDTNAVLSRIEGKISEIYSLMDPMSPTTLRRSRPTAMDNTNSLLQTVERDFFDAYHQDRHLQVPTTTQALEDFLQSSFGFPRNQARDYANDLTLRPCRYTAGRAAIQQATIDNPSCAVAAKIILTHFGFSEGHSSDYSWDWSSIFGEQSSKACQAWFCIGSSGSLISYAVTSMVPLPYGQGKSIGEARNVTSQTQHGDRTMRDGDFDIGTDRICLEMFKSEVHDRHLAFRRQWQMMRVKAAESENVSLMSVFLRSNFDFFRPGGHALGQQSNQECFSSPDQSCREVLAQEMDEICSPPVDTRGFRMRRICLPNFLRNYDACIHAIFQKWVERDM